eukprot:5270033-Prymnesium_polylepis.1
MSMLYFRPSESTEPREPDAFQRVALRPEVLEAFLSLFAEDGGCGDHSVSARGGGKRRYRGCASLTLVRQSK